ncbi:hypothetical protein [Rhizobium sp. MHM7A]|uniref:hypothetical protein n=1 Tax=Rhizobium sp. MHM7A TaxID=2583233 RepID=UPI00110595BC|nr:hypothetical protein [Rhizobium sp. MHM7A]TLX16480.1 hypothetical protein FFR93_03850 [Rhizobium sp. MHM7A]
MINRTISYLSQGTRVLVHDPRKLSATSFAEIKVDLDGKRNLVTPDGSIYLNQGYGSFRHSDKPEEGIAVAWAGPFPALSDESIITYYHSLAEVQRHRRNSSDPSLLIHLTEVSDGTVRGKIVEGLNSRPRHGRDEDENNSVTLGHIVVGVGELNISTVGIPEGARRGDVLVSSDFSCQATVNEDKSLTYTVTLEHVAILGNAGNPNELLALVPDSTSETRASEYEQLGFTFQSFDIMSAGDVRYQEDAARARTEPDLGLFISIPDKKGNCYPAFLTGTGIQLFGHNLYGVEDLLKTPCPPQGVWAFVDPEFWAGSYDTDIGPEWSQELNGSFVPATREHLEQLEISLGELGETILEYMRDNGHDVRGEALECANAWMELAPSYQSEPALTL